MNRRDSSADAAVRSPRMRSPDRSQVDPDPKTIDDLIPPGHKARLAWELVRDLDMTTLYDQIKAVEGHAGRPAIDPRILTVLWLHASIEGLTDLETIGQDGMRVRASAGNASFKKAETLERLLEEAEQRWDELQEEFEQETELSARQQAAQERAARERIERRGKGSSG